MLRTNKQYNRIPWFMYPSIAQKVLNRVMNKVPYSTSVDDIRALIDHCMTLLWVKVNDYHNTANWVIVTVQERSSHDNN